MQAEDTRKIRRWNFICSYAGIMLSGAGIFLICFLIYLAVRIPRGTDALTAIADFPRLFLVYTLPVIIIQTVFLIISNIVLIYKDGFRPLRLLGTCAGIACIILNLVSRLSVFTTLFMCYIEIFAIGMSVMSIAAVLHRPTMNNDYLIILGCSIGKDGKLLPIIKSRVNRAIHFAWEQEIATGKPICYIPSGGRGSDEIMSEGDAMSLYLLSHSAENYEVMKEMESGNTYENFLFSKKIIDEHDPDANVVFVTTNYHVLRSGMLAKKAGLKAEGLSSRVRWFFWPNGYIREMAAIIVMHKKEQLIALIVCLVLTVLLHIAIV
ncbi:MAG: YdcF family protein [Lachnospiraceae bacterium]|nr:YdcF family protein [Lachnospiraceae bacterium]